MMIGVCQVALQTATFMPDMYPACKVLSEVLIT